MSVPVTSHQVSNFTILQPSAPSIGTGPVPSAQCGTIGSLTSVPTATLVAASSLNLPPSTGSTGAQDIHICGTCNLQFSDLKAFTEHKQQRCSSNSAASGSSQNANFIHGQITLCQPPYQGSGPPGSSLGTPYVVLPSTTGGPSQTYRIIFRPNDLAAAPLLHATLAAGLQQAPQHPGSPMNPQQSRHICQHQQLHEPQPQFLSQQQGMPVPAEQQGNPHPQQPPRMTLNATNGVQTSTSLQQLSTVSTAWLKDGGGGGRFSRKASKDIIASSVSEITQGGCSEGVLEQENSESSSMHTEEEDVAAFLATQLASQSVPNSTNLGADQLISSVITGGNEAPQSYYTSAPNHQPLNNCSHIEVHLPQCGNEEEDEEEQDDGTETGVKAGQNYKSRGMETARSSLATTPARRSMVLSSFSGREKSKLKACPQENCRFTSYHNKDLVRHMRIHTGERPYKCNCGASFTRSDKLKLHGRIHSNYRPYLCQQPGCSYQGIDSGSLKKHMRTHTNERPYECQLCTYCSKDKSQLTVHLRSHTGDSPFVCMHGDCTSAFKTSSDLRRHERLHTGEKPYKCPTCEYVCAIKSNLTVHIRLNHHKGDKLACTKCDYVGKSRKELKDHEKSHSRNRQQMGRRRIYEPPARRSGTVSHSVGSGSEDDGVTHSSRGRPLSSRGRRRSRPNCYKHYKCQDCGMSFVREDSLRSHMRQHMKHMKALPKTAKKVAGDQKKGVYSIVVKKETIMPVEEPSNADLQPVQQLERQDVAEAASSIQLAPSSIEVAENPDTPLAGVGTTGTYRSCVFTIDGIDGGMVTVETRGTVDSIPLVAVQPNEKTPEQQVYNSGSGGTEHHSVPMNFHQEPSDIKSNQEYTQSAQGQAPSSAEFMTDLQAEGIQAHSILQPTDDQHLKREQSQSVLDQSLTSIQTIN